MENSRKSELNLLVSKKGLIIKGISLLLKGFVVTLNFLSAVGIVFFLKQFNELSKNWHRCTQCNG